MSSAGWGGKRVAGVGKKIGAPSKAERLARDGAPQGMQSVMGRPHDDAHQACAALVSRQHALQAGGLGGLQLAWLPRDIMALVKRWKADGHLSAVMKDASGPRAKEVLERKAREHTVSFLS